ncbi:hypothetical protein K2173_023525 [Erythroxylum novogranatense]|uniref:Uncharacterized protein n=1 Tax=Erythroxylum novogranatense TaxID=1862640 RepID=A0AAV8TNX2_9ROSI|nr:hypothetical protein K2173_023525 [Erythroxylum novogranatense]
MGILGSRRGLIISCCVLLLALVAGGQSLPSQNKTEIHQRQLQQRNCTYVVTIETTCSKGAETSNHVGLRFGDTNSNKVVERHLNSKHVGKLDPLQPAGIDDDVAIGKPFEACTVDQFKVKGHCMESPICNLYLKLSGTDDWRPGYAQIRVLERSNLSSQYFYFRRFLPRRAWHGSDMCDTEVTPFGIKRKSKF